MKRSGPLKRRTPLRSRSVLRFRKRVDTAWVEAKAVVRERSGGRCEVGSVVCTGVAGHVHHVARRSQVRGHAPELLLDACPPCHEYLHAHVAESLERGWLKHGWEVLPRG